MSRRFILFTGLLALVALLGLGGVLASRNLAVREYLRARAAHAVVGDYVDNAVLKALELLVADIGTLHDAARNLQAAPDAGRLDAAARAWHAAYGNWLTLTAYRYGPAAQHDYHKRLETWPFEKVLAGHAMDRMEAGELEVTSRYLREDQMAGLRGFQAALHLLFRDGRPRDVADIRPVELRYLVAVTQALLEDGVDFEATWRGTESLSPAKRALLQAAGIKTRPAYAEEFRNPGAPGSRYASVSVSLQEIFQEIGGTLEDMLPVMGELPGTLAAASPAYWDSLAPCDDLLNQLRSVENAYLGGVVGFRGRSVSELVAGHDRALDRLIKISLAHARHRLEAVRDARGKPSEERELAIRVAEGEIEKLIARVSAATPVVVLDPATRPYAAYVK